MLVIIAVIIIAYIYFVKLMRLKNSEFANKPVDLSVATFKPQIKSGNSNIKLLNLGPDKEATLKTVNRYLEEKLENVEENQLIMTNLNIYSAEDLIDELKYIGADAIIIENIIR